jgi:hypothetical protein
LISGDRASNAAKRMTTLQFLRSCGGDGRRRLNA